MKVIISIPILLLSTLTIKAQLPIIEINKTWNVASCSSAAPVCTTLFYKFGDAVEINETSYTEVLVADYKTPNLYNLVGYLREDKNGKAYFISKNSTEEGLLYDFSLNKSDTIHLQRVGFGQCCASTTIVDSIKILNYNGVDRKTMFLSSILSPGFYPYKTQTVWIEGIGSLYGVLQPVNCMIVGGYFYLLCTFENDQLLYKNPDEISCIISSVDDDEFQNNIQIFTSNESLVIANNSGKRLQVSIFNIDGKLLCDQTIMPNTIEYIPKGSLMRGIHIVSTKTDTNAFNRKVIIL